MRRSAAAVYLGRMSIYIPPRWPKIWRYHLVHAPVNVLSQFSLRGELGTGRDVPFAKLQGDPMKRWWKKEEKRKILSPKFEQGTLAGGFASVL